MPGDFGESRLSQGRVTNFGVTLPDLRKVPVVGKGSLAGGLGLFYACIHIPPVPVDRLAIFLL